MLAASLLVGAALGLTFTLDAGQTRCVSEMIPARSLIAGDWDVSDTAADSANSGASSSSSTAVRVRAPDGNAVFSNEERHGHFAVTARAAGVHRICFESSAPSARTVALNLKTALEVEDHGTVAKKEHVEAIEAELESMKRMAVHVYEEMLFMRSRSDAQHTANASMRGRLLWVEVVAMFGVLLMGLWQIRYLRNYFRVKKLI